jgi:hypothetical protein
MAGKCEPWNLKVGYCCRHLGVFKGKAEVCVLLVIEQRVVVMPDRPFGTTY